jgi:hypothetical protein
METEPISMAYFINRPHPSVCLYAYPFYGCKAIARLSASLFRCYATAQYTGSSGNQYTQQKNCWTRHFLGDPCLIRGESMGLSISLSLLDNNSVKTFPRPRNIVGGVVFHGVRVDSKESRRLVPPKLIVFVSFCTFLKTVPPQEAQIGKQYTR